MKFIKKVGDFLLNRKVDAFCKKHNISNYQIVDGLVNVDGDVNLYESGLTKLPIKFGKVRNFRCLHNKLTSLEGCPTKVDGDFDCSHNMLTSLEGCPNEISGSLICSGNMLTSLEGCPTEVNDLYCWGNQLTNFIGGPGKINGKINANSNDIIDFRGIPDDFLGTIELKNNPVYYIWNFFRDSSKIELFNYMDIVDPIPLNRPTVHLVHLNAFLEEIGKKEIASIRPKNSDDNDESKLFLFYTIIL